MLAKDGKDTRICTLRQCAKNALTRQIQNTVIMASKMIKTPISYYGGKQNLIKHILPLIPNHVQYCEPFVGGAAVFFAKKPSQIEVINDYDNRVVNFWFVLLQNLNP